VSADAIETKRPQYATEEVLVGFRERARCRERRQQSPPNGDDALGSGLSKENLGDKDGKWLGCWIPPWKRPPEAIAPRQKLEHRELTESRLRLRTG